MKTFHITNQLFQPLPRDSFTLSNTFALAKPYIHSRAYTRMHTARESERENAIYRCEFSSDFLPARESRSVAERIVARACARSLTGVRGFSISFSLLHCARFPSREFSPHVRNGAHHEEFRELLGMDFVRMYMCNSHHSGDKIKNHDLNFFFEHTFGARFFFLLQYIK